MQKLILFSTSACHLCEEAKALLMPVILPRALQLIEVDIASDDRLIDLYGTRIPVLKNDSGVELGWPFTEKQLLELIKP